MNKIIDYTRTFSEVTSQTLVDMFGVETTSQSEIEESSSVETDRSFIVSLYYTGSVYGEYLLALDESTAAGIIGLDSEITDENRDEVREEFCDALSETLNTIVGESIVHVQETHPKLTLTAPRIIFGKIKYPQFKTGRTVIQTDAGPIECHFCLDLMRLDLATSYDEAMETILGVNEQLKAANRNLAEQQAQLVHTERMASVGILASGVAHEINNPLFFVDANLTALTDYVSTIESVMGLYEQLKDSLEGCSGTWNKQLDSIREETDEQDLEFVMEDTKQLMSETRQGIGRIREIVQSLKDFSQAERVGSAEADVNVIVENSCGLFANDLPEGCVIEKHFDDLPKLVCNAAEIGQVLATLILNAKQAIAKDGCIVVTSRATKSDVILTVEDNGDGIPDEHIEHIFEPFYSTKPEGEGSGLGLSIAYGLVHKHNGSISITSENGAGTKATITLPIASTMTQQEPVSTANMES